MSRTRSNYYPNAFDTIQRALANELLNSPGLAIKAGASPTVKAANGYFAYFEGTTVFKAASDMPALSGTIANTNKGLVVFTLKSDGTLTARKGGYDVASYAALVWPTVPDGEIPLGAVIIENGTGSTFTGGTTALDTASLTVTYISMFGPILPGLEGNP
jgi:hypothetical protein